MKGCINIDTNERSLKMHYDLKGKIEVVSRVNINNADDLTLAYTPGVAQPCLKIKGNKEEVYNLTRRGNLVAVITDGSAVLGLGDIGPEASMPVMEGKCALFKEFADIDAFPICINSKDIDEIVNTIYLISKSFGAINLEDISAPRCFEIEKRLREKCAIPIFHDDQHGTAVVVGAALINSLKIVKKDFSNIKVVISGAGAAGIATAKFLLFMGVQNIIMLNSKGIICEGDETLNNAQKEIATLTNKEKLKGTLKEAIKGADVFIGVSVPNVLTEELVKEMNFNAIVFAMANPIPEIMPDKAKKGGARIVGTGRSDCKNQINNVLAYPGIFRGALDTRAKVITEEMKLVASKAIASLVSDDELNEDYILPNALDKRVVGAIANAIKKLNL